MFICILFSSVRCSYAVVRPRPLSETPIPKSHFIYMCDNIAIQIHII